MENPYQTWWLRRLNVGGERSTRYGRRRLTDLWTIIKNGILDSTIPHLILLAVLRMGGYRSGDLPKISVDLFQDAWKTNRPKNAINYIQDQLRSVYY